MSALLHSPFLDIEHIVQAGRSAALTFLLKLAANKVNERGKPVGADDVDVFELTIATGVVLKGHLAVQGRKAKQLLRVIVGELTQPVRSGEVIATDEVLDAFDADSEVHHRGLIIGGVDGEAVVIGGEQDVTAAELVSGMLHDVCGGAHNKILLFF